MTEKEKNQASAPTEPEVGAHIRSWLLTPVAQFFSATPWDETELELISAHRDFNFATISVRNNPGCADDWRELMLGDLRFQEAMSAIALERRRLLRALATVDAAIAELKGPQR